MLGAEVFNGNQGLAGRGAAAFRQGPGPPGGGLAADQPEKLWLEVAQRRYRSYKQGKTKARPAEQAFRAARAKIR